MRKFLEERNAIVIANNIHQPRVLRRIEGLMQLGFQVYCYAFSRGLYQDNKPPNVSNMTDLGVMKDGHYFLRIIKLLGIARRIRANLESKRPEVLYCFGMDCGFLALSAGIKGSRSIYEIADLRYSILEKGVSGRFLGLIDAWILKHMTHVVLTSEGFCDQYKSLGKGRQRLVVIENKISERLPKVAERPKESREDAQGVIHLGFVGLIRYLPCLLPLIEGVGRRREKFAFHVFGDGAGVSEVKRLANKYENVHYYGSFKSPEDLGEIYSKIDISVAVYDSRNFNVRLAIPNKLYEAIYFSCPLVVSENTALSKRIREWDVGFVVDPFEDDFPDGFLERLSWESIELKRKACFGIATERLVQSHKELEKALFSEG